MTFEILLKRLTKKTKNELITFITGLELIDGKIKPNPWNSDVLKQLKINSNQLAKIQRFKEDHEELIKQKLGEAPNLSPEEETLLREIAQKVDDKKYGEKPQFQIQQVDVKNFKELVIKLKAFLPTNTPQENLIKRTLTQTHVPGHGGMLQFDHVTAISSVFQQFKNRLNFESNWKALRQELVGHPTAEKIETSEAAKTVTPEAAMTETSEAAMTETSEAANIETSEAGRQNIPQISKPVKPDDKLEAKKEAVYNYLKLLAAKLKDRNIQDDNLPTLEAQRKLPPYEQKLIARYNAMLYLHDMITQSINTSAHLDENQATSHLSTCITNKPDWGERDLLKKVLDCFTLGLTALWRRYMSKESDHQKKIEALVTPPKKP